MVEGYQRRIRPAGVYYRELFALLYNIKRGDNPYLMPEDVLRLPGDKRARKPRTRSHWTDKRIADVLARTNTPPSSPTDP